MVKKNQSNTSPYELQKIEQDTALNTCTINIFFTQRQYATYIFHYIFVYMYYNKTHTNCHLIKRHITNP